MGVVLRPADLWPQHHRRRHVPPAHEQQKDDALQGPVGTPHQQQPDAAFAAPTEDALSEPERAPPGLQWHVDGDGRRRLRRVFTVPSQLDFARVYTHRLNASDSVERLRTVITQMSSAQLADGATAAAAAAAAPLQTTMDALHLSTLLSRLEHVIRHGGLPSDSFAGQTALESERDAARREAQDLVDWVMQQQPQCVRQSSPAVASSVLLKAARARLRLGEPVVGQLLDSVVAGARAAVAGAQAGASSAPRGRAKAAAATAAAATTWAEVGDPKECLTPESEWSHGWRAACLAAAGWQGLHRALFASPLLEIHSLGAARRAEQRRVGGGAALPRRAGAAPARPGARHRRRPARPHARLRACAHTARSAVRTSASSPAH